MFYSKNVQHLTSRTFKKAVQGSEKLTVAAFVAPWCGYCKQLSPKFDGAADNLKGLVNFGGWTTGCACAHSALLAKSELLLSCCGL